MSDYERIDSFLLILPIFFLFIAFLEDKGVWGKFTIIRYAIFTTCITLVFIIPTSAFNQIDILGFELFFTPLNEISLFVFLICFAFLLAHAFLESKSIDKSAPWALLLCGYTIIHPNSLTLLYLGFSSVIFLIALLQDAYRMAFIDTLTQVPSRRAMEEYFQSLTPPFSIAMADIDHFKSFNDKYGHDIGDAVLKQVATSLVHVQKGKVFRYGGEEFAIVFKNLSAKECKKFLDTVRQNIQDGGFVVKKDEPKVSLTLSFGVADSTFADDTNSIIKHADTALYKAKKGGRNKVEIAHHKKTVSEGQR